MRRAWIEIPYLLTDYIRDTSPSLRRAWIEIIGKLVSNWLDEVALLAEGVDRNCTVEHKFPVAGVALLAEGVDRNFLLRYT